MRSVSPPTPTMRLTSVGVTSSGDIRIRASCGGEMKTVTSPRFGLAYSGSDRLVNGMCGPKPKLVDEEPISDEEGRLHATAWNPEGLGE